MYYRTELTELTLRTKYDFSFHVVFVYKMLLCCQTHRAHTSCNTHSALASHII